MSCVNREQLRKDLLLYAVTDRSWLGNETLYEQVEKALKGDFYTASGKGTR